MDKLYTIQEVALKLNLSDKTLRRWEEAGRFTPSRTLGNQRRYSLEDLQILDAIKHGTLESQRDLLTLKQVSNLCGVSPTTVLRYEDSGKIHPFITSLNTYYIRQKLLEKMDELKKIYVEPAPAPVSPGSDLSQGTVPVTQGSDLSQGTVLKRNPRLQAEEGSPAGERTVPTGTPQSPTYDLRPIIANTLITLTLIIVYHLLFYSSPPKPISPQGSVQGVTTTTDPRIDDLIAKFQSHLSAEMLKDAGPIPTTTLNLAGTSLVTSSATLPKGKDQVSVPAEKITTLTPVTATFTSDYAPAKKYWITTNQGSFTLHTDFAVGADTTFNYSFIVPSSTPSAIIKP